MTDRQQNLLAKAGGRSLGSFITMYLAQRALKTLGHEVRYRDVFAATVLIRYASAQVAESVEDSIERQRAFRVLLYG